MARPLPSWLRLRPIDEHARDGRFQLVFGGNEGFAVARWREHGWEFASGVPLHFDPVEYRADRHEGRA